MPPYRHVPSLDEVHVAASPEWFGDGAQAFRQLVVRRSLAEALVAASPRDFSIRDLPR
jgi:hypothetical protein